MSAEQRVAVEFEGRRLELSNLDKVLYPACGFTKGDVLAYYVSVGPTIVAHLAGRPATFVRYPDGVEGGSFFEKNIPSYAPGFVHRMTVPRRPGEAGGRAAAGARGSAARTTIEHAVIDDVASLVWAANLATIELHVPMWRAGAAGTPGDLAGTPGDLADTLVLDLDPGQPATLVECCEVALELARRLEDLGLRGVPKTSGRKGLQVYAPLRPARPWRESQELAHDLARLMERDSGGLVVSNMRRDLRAGRVLLDWSQNHPAKTTVAPYSLRAADRPAVSTPLSWDEVERCAASRDAAPLRFEAADVMARLERRGDLFASLVTR